MNNEQRNLNPTPAARIAMVIWGKEYASQGGGSMDFWDSLAEVQKKRCELAANAVIEQCAKVCDEVDKSTHPSDLADLFRQNIQQRNQTLT